MTWPFFRRFFFFPSPHIPGKVGVRPWLPANVGAPFFFLPGPVWQADYTNRRAPVHRSRGSGALGGTWPFWNTDLAVAPGAFRRPNPPGPGRSHAVAGTQRPPNGAHPADCGPNPRPLTGDATDAGGPPANLAVGRWQVRLCRPRFLALLHWPPTSLQLPPRTPPLPTAPRLRRVRGPRSLYWAVPHGPRKDSRDGSQTIDQTPRGCRFLKLTRRPERKRGARMNIPRRP